MERTGKPHNSYRLVCSSCREACVVRVGVEGDEDDATDER